MKRLNIDKFQGWLEQHPEIAMLMFMGGIALGVATLLSMTT
jgi:hypothetical protein